MFIRCELAILILALTLDGRVHTAEIIGGHVAAPHSRPYMAILESIGQNGLKVICGGFLLNEDFVMTAAHCKPSQVLLGVHNYHKSNGMQRIKVKERFRHTDYDAKTLNNDIMLLKLESRATLTKNVQPITFASHDNGSLPASCTVAGWGYTVKDRKTFSAVLMEANVTLTDEHCQKNSTYCSKAETGPTNGDSGGPLVCEEGEAYGVVSGGTKNSIIYTKIAAYTSWIKSTMEHHHG
ncbi:Granzyme D [Collichthys lucidus]|uniref:trypsin n=1 Tax=Collichthys lucidus TaxID=240159 RepID=A0A4U5UIY0_COLLU|nr:Granzyme D [Collichthys lucidus]